MRQGVKGKQKPQKMFEGQSKLLAGMKFGRREDNS
jgi:hypothetical protein